MIKQRIARKGEGKSGGSRTILLFRQGDRAVFVDGFEKKNQANISLAELRAYRNLARLMLSQTKAQWMDEIEGGALIEVLPPVEVCDGEKVQK